VNARAQGSPVDVLAWLRGTGSGPPVVSLYLDTRWADEHQRNRARVFLKHEVRKARASAEAALLEDLAWVEEEGQRLVDQAEHVGARGVALFASSARGLRAVVPVRAPFDDALFVADHPVLTPLAGLAGDPMLVVFVDGERARLIPVDAGGAGEEVVLEHETVGRHRRGGWALLAQNRYQRHVEVHRDQHFEGVATTLGHLAEELGVGAIVLAGEARTVTAFRKHLSPALARAVLGAVSGAGYEPAATLVERAEALRAASHHEREARSVEAVLVEAAKGGRAVAGLERTLDATARGAVHCLYVLKAFDVAGGRCSACGRLQRDDSGACDACAAEIRPVQLGDAVVERVVAAGGRVEVVHDSVALERAGGVAARLRYAV
jgi:hypothetical protein